MKVIRILTLITALFSGVPSLAADSVQATSPVSLTGEKAVAQLKESGQYDSIAAAYEAARHAVRADEAEPDGVLHAQNPGHGLSASFDRHGLHLSVQRHGSEGERLTTRWRLDSVGRDGAVEKVPAGDALRRDGQRAEIVRAGLGLTEWFVNRPSGLEHGFTLDRRPAGEGALRLDIAIEGDLSPVPGAEGQRIELHDAAGAKVLEYDKLRVWDAAGQELPARMERAAAGGLRFLVEDAGAHYPLTVDPTFTQQAYLKASNTGADDRLGISVAVSGDTVVVGALREDSSTTGINSTPDESASNAGAAYVFVRSGNTWTQQAYLKASQVTASDNFGYSVAVSGNTVVVGAMNEDSSTTGIDSTANESAAEAGAAYVFVRSGTTWSQQAYLKASNPNPSDLFGWSVGVDGDTVAVGALNEDSNATGVNGNQSDNSAENSGAVYVFVRSGTTWTQQAYLKPATSGTTQAGDQFGTSVAVSGNTVVVGAQAEDSDTTGNNSTPNESATGAGAAYVFVRSGTTWTQQAYLKPAAFGTTQAGDQFGVSVAVSADTVVVGALREDSSTTGFNSTPNESAGNAGAAYVFVRSGTTWAQQAYLKPAAFGTTQAGDQFGISVAVSGDTVVVGAVLDDSSTAGINSTPNESAGDAGAAYVFVRSGSTWTQQAYLKASQVTVGDNFGNSVAASGGSVVIGAPFDDSNTTGTNSTPNESATDAGAAYVYTLIPDPTLTSVSPNTGSTAGGTAVTLTGTGFTGATNVTFGGTAATNRTVVNATTITCTTPARAAGTASVLVTTPGGTNAANTLFTYAAPSGMDVIFNTFGPGDSYSNSGTGVGRSDGVSFTLSKAFVMSTLMDVTVDGIDVAAILFSGTNAVVLSLRSETAGIPGATLESWTITGLGPFGAANPLKSVTSVSRPTLLAGQRYWLTMSGGAADTQASWNYSGDFVNRFPTYTTRDGVGTTSNDFSTAFRVRGATAIPVSTLTTAAYTGSNPTLHGGALYGFPIVSDTRSSPATLSITSTSAGTLLSGSSPVTGNNLNTGFRTNINLTLPAGQSAVEQAISLALGPFDDGLRLDYNGQTVLDFDFSNYTNIPAVNSMFGGGWTPWTGEGAPIVMELDASGLRLMVTAVSNGTGTAAGVLAGQRVNVLNYFTPDTYVPDPADPDFVSGVQIGLYNKNQGGGWAMPNATLTATARVIASLPPFRITAFSYNPTARTVNLTFLSEPAVNYTLETSPNGQTWTVLGAQVPGAAGAATTTVTVRSLSSLPVTSRLLRRVRRP